MISVRNLANGTLGDVTTGFTNTTPSAGIATPVSVNQGLTVHARLSGGTSASFQLEGSNDGVNFSTLQAAATALSSPGSQAVVNYTVNTAFIRLNPVSNVGGGTLIALLSSAQ